MSYEFDPATRIYTITDLNLIRVLRVAITPFDEEYGVDNISFESNNLAQFDARPGQGDSLLNYLIIEIIETYHPINGYRGGLRQARNVLSQSWNDIGMAVSALTRELAA